MIVRAINAIVIHCAATPNGAPYPVAQIDRDHQARGFHRQAHWLKQWNPHLPAIGYHYYIGTDGLRSNGRHLEEIGAHVQGSNARSIGICMAGTDRFTAMQWMALKALVMEVARHLSDGRVQQPYPMINADQVTAALSVMGVRLLGHRDFSPDLDGDGIIERHEWMKYCPGFDVETWKRSGFTAQPAHLC
jgi:N-acetyl-anhydromuramyl-L-alanine amidase AmpD